MAQKKAAKKAAAKAEEKPKVENKKPTHEAVKRFAEAGEVYDSGDKLHLTKKRAESLGALVKPITSE
jgi:hypothetical protein